MGLLDTLTGGENDRAREALNRAQQNFAAIETPTASDLTLPELQKYVQAGILTPAQAQAYLVQGNAYNDIKVDPSTTEAQQDVLSRLKDVSSSNGMTDEMKAQLTSALDQVATQEHGANAAISDQFAQRGIPSSLMAEAAMRDEAGNDSRTANLVGTQAAGQAEANAIASMMNEGNLASTMHGQQYNEASQKAQAENAMREWNAGTQTGVSEANTGRAQTAKQYNAGVTQDTSNRNTANANRRTEYNAQVPETIFQNKIQKAGGQSTVANNQANQAMNAGNQEMGLYGAIIGGGSQMLAPHAMAAADGAIVPGNAEVPGDSPRNDTVHAMLSPGEVVVPRSISHNPEMVKSFVTHLLKKPVAPAHPDDVHSVLEALSKRRAA